MKAIHLKCVTALAMSLSACACIPSVEEPVQTATPAPAPAATQAPAPIPTPAPTPVPVVNEPTFENYLDAPQTEGTWTYVKNSSGNMAAYGTSSRQPDFLVRCTGRSIALARATQELPTSRRAMTVTTETSIRNVIAEPLPSSGPLGAKLVAVNLDPQDPIFDAMAITKGRIAIGVEGERTLYLPAWVEISRVIEDCR